LEVRVRQALAVVLGAVGLVDLELNGLVEILAVKLHFARVRVADKVVEAVENVLLILHVVGVQLLEHPEGIDIIESNAGHEHPSCVLIWLRNNLCRKWRSTISVAVPKPDWEGLERKLRTGMSLERAAEAMGIELRDAQEFVSKRLEDNKLDGVFLHLAAQDAIKVGLKTLKQIAKAGVRSGLNTRDADLEAAKALVKFGLDAKKTPGAQLMRDGKGGARVSVQLDLWDTAGNWELADQSK
jgi:hypothetical protein